MIIRLPHKVRRLVASFAKQPRDPRYIFVLIFGALLFLLTMVQALNAGWFDSIERPIFQDVNNLPHYFQGIMVVLTQFGSFGSFIVWVPVAWYLVNRRAAATLAASGFAAWLIAKVAKLIVHRGRPQDLLDSVHLFNSEHFSGYGFPSGHATFSAACATVLYYQVPARYKKYVLLVVFLVGLSRMYLGAHFPLDVLGGWALGAMTGAGIMLIAGSSRKTIAVPRIKRALARQGYDMQHVHFADVDARGSRPLFMEDARGKHYFGKIFGLEEHAADWLFKLYRFFRYKNLQAEEPYLSGRRNVEIESFFTLWARKSGVRVPNVVDLLRIGNHWLLLQEKLDATSLSDTKRVTEKTLEDAWKQVRKLHGSNIAHRDLRAANLMVDKKGQVWVIDFCFAESAPQPRRKRMDIAELLMSMALVVGAKRTVAAAASVLDRDELKKAMPYMQKSVFSGATRQGLRADKSLLKDVMLELHKILGTEENDINQANIDRLNGKRLLNILLLAVFVYAVLPQLKIFSGTLHHLNSVNPVWVAIVVLFSVLTYIAAAYVYVALSNVPLKLREVTLVQLAASFMSKVVPGGLGSTSLNARYLTRAGVEAADASAVIIVQGTIGFVMFIVPLLIFLLVGGEDLRDLLKFHLSIRVVYGVLVALVVAGGVLAMSKSVRTKVLEGFAKLRDALRDISSNPTELSLASAASLGITLCYIVCLFAAVHAFGVALSWPAIILVYASAIIAKSAVPTPGGLGPLEIAMAASMVALGVDRGAAFAVVVLYRLATFWVPIPFSLLAYRYVNKRHII
jgi:undecaprenyl-diphosphatase